MIEVQKTDHFDRWLSELRDRAAKVKILQRLERLALGNPGDVRDVGEGVSELRINFGPGYRVYYARIGRAVVILLCGGDKATQDSDIRIAKRLAVELKG